MLQTVEPMFIPLQLDKYSNVVTSLIKITPQMQLLLKTLLAFACFSTSLQAAAQDAFSNYVADIHLSESRQFRLPEPVIRYSDGDNGALLKSVLNPAQVKEMMAIYMQRSKQGASPANFPQLLAPMLNRYQKAFETRGNAYENEYLDSIEITSFMTIASMAMMNGAQSLNLSDKDGSKSSSDQEKMIDSLNSLVKSMGSLMATIKQKIATDLRKKVETGKFSAEGAKRALKLADSLTASVQ
jgi:hypothetical protein